MLSLAFALLVLNPIVADARPKHHGCSDSHGSYTHSGHAALSAASSAASSVTSIPASNVTSALNSTALSSLMTIVASTALATGVPTVTPIASPPSSVAAIVATTEPSAEEPTEVSDATSATVTTTSDAIINPSNLAQSVVSSVQSSVEASEQCGNSARLNLPGTGMTIANSMYNADSMTGTQCTNYDDITTEGVVWTSVTDIEKTNDKTTQDLCKGYSNIGIGTNLKNRLSDISSIPAYFKWSRTNTTEFRGSNLFDFVTSSTAGADPNDPVSSEFMLWIEIWGDQVPIGYSRGPVTAVDLFGISFDVYEGQNPGTGVTVRSLLPTGSFKGAFQGDLKDWLSAMVGQGYIKDSDFVNVGNAGAEIFYGNSVMDATVSLKVEV